MKLKRCLIVALFLACTTTLLGQDSATRPKPATIEGVVTKIGTGEPLSDVRVTATPESGGAGKGATTNAQGRFTIPDLLPGAYNLDAVRTLFVREKRNTALHLNLAADQHLSDVHIQLMPTAVMTGHVYDENRQPLQSVRAEAMRWQYRDGARVLVAAGQAQTDDRGEYRIFNLQPGAYYVRATPAPNSLQAAYAPVYYPGVIDAQDAVAITVVAGGEGTADLTIGANRTFSVRLKIAGAFSLNPSPAVTFLAVRRGRGVPDLFAVQTQSLGGGAYRLSNFIPGSYEIVAQVRLTVPQAMVQTGRLEVTIGDEDVDAGALPLHQNASLAGRIIVSEPLGVTLDPTKLAVLLRPMGATPVISSATSRSTGGAMTGDGAFTIPNVGSGRCRVEVTGLPANVYLTSARYGGAEVIDSGISIDTQPEGQLELHLGGAGSVGTIDGVVRDRNDQPVPSSVVAIIPAPDRRDNPAAFKTATTDQLGIFSIRGLLPGEYRVLAWEDVEPGAYQNSEFLSEFETRAVKTTVERGGRNVVNVRIIPRSD